MRIQKVELLLHHKICTWVCSWWGKARTNHKKKRWIRPLRCGFGADRPADRKWWEKRQFEISSSSKRTFGDICIHHVWSKYNDLTRPISPKKVAKEGKSPSVRRLVKYYNLARPCDPCWDWDNEMMTTGQFLPKRNQYVDVQDDPK